MKLAAKLPKDHSANGVEHGEAAFLARPLEQVVVVAYLGTARTVIDYDNGGREAIVQVQAIEIIEDDDALRAVRAAFEAAHDARVNRAPTLPTEPEDDEPEWPACEDCGHGRDEHSGSGVCTAYDESGDACECNEYLALCACGHPWGLHDVDDGECCVIDEDLTVGECDCREFVPMRLGEATGGVVEAVEEIDDPDATEPGVPSIGELADNVRTLHATG